MVLIEIEPCVAETMQVIGMAEIIANENTSPVPRNVDAVDNLRMNLQVIHKMLTQIMIKEAKNIVNK